MSDRLVLKPRINSSNNQINISLPKRKLPKKLIKDISNVKELDFLLEGWR